MAEEPKQELRVDGPVGKLTTIGTVMGNVLIVDERVTRGTLETLSRETDSSQFRFSDIADYIRVILKSNRFGRKVQFQIPSDMTVSAFIALVVKTLQLPRTKHIDELMISIQFSYSLIFGEEELQLNKTLRQAGIQNESELQLFVSHWWKDELETGGGVPGVMYHLNFDECRRLEEARETRGPLTRRKIRKIKSLANSCFAFIDEIGKQ